MGGNGQSEVDICYDDHRQENSFIDGLREAPGEDMISKLRSIVSDHAVMLVDGHPVDATSANVVVQVHDSLRPENRAKLVDRTVLQAVDTSFKVLQKAKGRP